MPHAPSWRNAIELLRQTHSGSALLDRRSLLTRSALGLRALGLAQVLQDDGRMVAAEAATDGSLIARAPHFPPRAKRVIHFFLNGGPSHVDTFDHKPLLAKYAGLPLGDNLRTERKTGACNAIAI